VQNEECHNYETLSLLRILDAFGFQKCLVSQDVIKEVLGCDIVGALRLLCKLDAQLAN